MAYEELETSVGQRLLWFLDRYRGDGGALNCPAMCRIRGPLDVAALRSALAVVVRRHESLRTTFAGGGRRLVQHVHDTMAVDLREIDLRAEPDPESTLAGRVAAELRTRIDASVAPLRLTLWRVGDDDHVLCLNMHHLVTDSWSCGVVFEDLCAALDSGDGRSRPEDGWQYRQFVEAQRTELSGAGLDRLQSYWRRQLDGMRLPSLPMAPEGPGRTGRRTALVRAEIGPDAVARLQTLARTGRSTLFSVLLTVYYLGLFRTTGQSDLAVASLFANRTRPQTRRTTGFLANMVVLRTRLDPRRTFVEQVRATHATVVDGFIHQGLPYQMLPLSNEGGGQRADDVVFQLLADPVYTTTSGGAEIEVLVPDGVGSRFEFELVLVPTGAELRVLLFYDADRIPAEYAERFVAEYVRCAEATARDPRLPVGAR